MVSIHTEAKILEKAVSFTMAKLSFIVFNCIKDHIQSPPHNRLLTIIFLDYKIAEHGNCCRSEARLGYTYRLYRQSMPKEGKWERAWEEKREGERRTKEISM